MPVFTFEKISPPVRRGPAPEIESDKKPRGVIIQLLDRIVEGRAKRTARHGDHAIAHHERFPTK